MKGSLRLATRILVIAVIFVALIGVAALTYTLLPR